MAPHEGLRHLQEYDIKDSNVELIGTEIDHRVKYKSSKTEPAWNNGKTGQVAGLYVWRIEDFCVIPWPEDKTGQFYDGDSYIVLHSYKIGEKAGQEKLGHDVFFWLGGKTTQDESGTAAYKTVELDEFLPWHVDMDAETKEITMLLRVFKLPSAGRADSIVVHEVEATWKSLDEEDVFILDKGDKIWVWQGKKCSPMEKAKAAQVVGDLTLAKHIDVEVLSQTEARARLVVDLLGGKGVEQREFRASRPIAPQSIDQSGGSRPQRLFRLSDATGRLSFDLVKEGQAIRRDDLDTNDVFVLDTSKAIWVWRGLGASERERAMWIKVAQSYLQQLQSESQYLGANLTPLAAVVEGNESPVFLRALSV